MKYQIIYADPPWTYEKTGGVKNSRGMAKQFYNTMSLEDIQNLPVNGIADTSCALFLWATYPKMPDALKVVSSWGFDYFGLGFEWIKKTKNGKDFFGMGYWTRANSEPLLMGFKGKMKPLRHDIRQIVEYQIDTHSKKPGIIRDKIVGLVGDLPRIELFAREKVVGWDCWGNEVESDIDLSNTPTGKEI
jgi:site-specific DNA-methyltransferase (adenine-specific)